MSENFPVCRSQLLQDLSIQLGRNLKGIRYSNEQLRFRNYREKDGVECLEINARAYSGELISVFLWETGQGQMILTPRAPKKHKRSSVERNDFAFDALTLNETVRLLGDFFKMGSWAAKRK